MQLSSIKEMATGKEVREIRHNYSPEELANLKDDFFNTDATLSAKQDAFDEVKAQFKEEMSPLKKQLGDLRKRIKNKFIDEEREVYKVANQDSGEMEFYCINTGELLDNRKLRPEERQHRMSFAKAEGE